uniref:Serine aminopeptidase S33 domain-containing protein n=1 Tax=Leersia perrieri TaxID=77586 RepID=A0A0D9V4E8_9ORYZ
MPLLHAANLRVLLAGAAVAHLSSPIPTTRASSPCAPPLLPLPRLRAFATYRASPPPPQPSSPSLSGALASASSAACERGEKPSICTADELHYVPVPGTEWRLALWRYRPPPEAPKRNHPLMLLSGVATNAIGFDLSPGASFARHMSMQGFDTWIVEVRGAGLSMRGSELAVANTTSDMSPSSSLDKVSTQKINGSEPAKDNSTRLAQNLEVSVIEENDIVESNTSEDPQLVTKLSDALERLGDTFSGYVKDSRLRSIADGFFNRVSELVPDASLTRSLEEVSEKILGLLELPQTSAISDQISYLSQRLVNILGEGQQNISPRLFGWQERLSATIEDLQKQLELIISYDWDFDHYLEEDVPAAMNYIRQQSSSKDGKMLAIGHSMGGILLYAMVSKCGFEGAEPGLAAIVTLASSVDYTTSNSSLKLLLPLVLLQLTTAFRDGGLRNRAGTFLFKQHLHKIKVPVLALAGDEDLICPPEAVYETVKLIPQRLVTYKVFGKPEGPHYAHYDLVGGRKAVHEVYPCIIEFLSQHDEVSS